MTTLRIFLGMIRHEFRLQWRRRGLLVVLLSLAAVLLLPALFGFETIIGLVGTSGANGGDGPEAARVLGWTIALYTLPVTAAAISLLLPGAMADTVALDKQRGVDELFNALPVPYGWYLGGKLAGMVAAAFAGLLALLAGFSLFWRLVADFDMRLFFEVWLFAAAALVLINGGLGVLVGATQPNRRRAALLVLGFLVITPALLVLVPWAGDLRDYINPWRPFMFRVLLPTDGTVPATIFTPPVLLTVAVGLIELLLAGGLVYALHARRQA